MIFDTDPGKKHAPCHLAFVEWFNVSTSTDPDNDMYSATKARERDGSRKVDIIFIEDIVQPCPLVPKFGRKASSLERQTQKAISAENCLEVVEEFWINSFHTKETYQTVY